MTNESTTDRVIRFVVGAALLATGVLAIDGIGGVALGVVGAILVFTGLVGFCPIYRVLGIRSSPESA